METETLAQVIRRTLKTYRPVKFARNCAWHAIYINVPFWWFSRPGTPAVARWLGPTQVACAIFDPVDWSGPFLQFHVIGRKGVKIMLPKSKHWWKLDGRRGYQRRQQRAAKRLEGL